VGLKNTNRLGFSEYKNMFLYSTTTCFSWTLKRQSSYFLKIFKTVGRIKNLHNSFFVPLSVFRYVAGFQPALLQFMNTVALHFETFGNAEQPPLVILHGFFASSRNWRHIAKELARDFHVYVLDARNHGDSPHHAVMDYDSMAGDLLAFFNAQQLARVHVLGHSMGGKTAMWFALQHPERVHKLIVADIAPVNYSHRFDHYIQALKALPLHDISNRKQAETWLSEAIPDLHYRQFLLQNLLLVEGHYRWRIDLGIFAQNADNIILFPQTDATFTGKTLFLAGEQSPLVQTDNIAAHFPNARLEVIADAGHWLHVQQPAAFLTAVQDFLCAVS
jgi:pimeloyl-ACP methyl ester carboxylesterase